MTGQDCIRPPSRRSHSWTEREVEFRFYEELNDFLPDERRKAAFGHRFRGTPAVRDLIQAVGVPHSEVDLVLVDGRSVGFDYRLRGGERVAVYPVFERLDISPLVHLRPSPLRRTRFALDVHLGRLARDLRLLGFDSTYRREWDDADLIDHALVQRRIILTRDVGLLKHSRVTHGYWLRSALPGDQLPEVIRALQLDGQLRPFSRCRECNGTIEPTAREALRRAVDPAILRRFERFWRCSGCRRVYWRGSHYRNLLRGVRRAVPGVRQEIGGVPAG